MAVKTDLPSESSRQLHSASNSRANEKKENEKASRWFIVRNVYASMCKYKYVYINLSI